MHSLVSRVDKKTPVPCPLSPVATIPHTHYFDIHYIFFGCLALWRVKVNGHDWPEVGEAALLERNWKDVWWHAKLTNACKTLFGCRIRASRLIIHAASRESSHVACLPVALGTWHCHCHFQWQVFGVACKLPCNCIHRFSFLRYLTQEVLLIIKRFLRIVFKSISPFFIFIFFLYIFFGNKCAKQWFKVNCLWL